MAVKPLIATAGVDVLSTSIALESAVPGLRFHPIGEGHGFLKNGVTSTVPKDQADKVVKWVKKQAWKSSSLNKAANVRKDGKWYVGGFEEVPGGRRTVHLFVSTPDPKDLCTVTIVTRLYKI